MEQADAQVQHRSELIAPYGRDIKVREGFKINNQVNLRLLTLF
jgi:hypothetical protein